MPEIVVTIGFSMFVLYALNIAAAWTVHGRLAGPRERVLFARWAAFSALFMAAVASWAVAGIFTFLFRTEFWRGANTSH